MAALAASGTLKGERLGAVVLAGPERWLDGELLVSLMQDVPHERQRIILASAPERAADLVERYARKALVLGAPGEAPQQPAGPVRTVAVAWSRRAAALGELLEVLDPRSLTVWTADRSRHAAIAAALPGGDATIRVATGDAPNAEVVVAFDPPDGPRLAQLLQAGAGRATGHAGHRAISRAGRSAPPSASTARAAGGRRRCRRQAPGRNCSRDRGRAPRAGVAPLAPLFERYDATAVAAAVYDLWIEAGAAVPALVAPPPEATITTKVAATAKVFVGVGKSDGATPNDLVAVLTKAVRVAREKIGRIELREAYSLVELPAQEAEQIASALNGVTIRRKRVVARIDRGRARPVAGAPGRGR